MFALEWEPELCVIDARTLELRILVMAPYAIPGLIGDRVNGRVAVRALTSNRAFAHLGAFMALDAGLLLVPPVEL